MPFECPACGANVYIPANKASRRKYCTRSCATATYNTNNFRGERNGMWKGGKALSYGAGWKELKEHVRRRDGTCRNCGKTPEENGRALDVHHLNPFRFSGSNAMDNLIALCRSCHMRADDHGRKGSARFLAEAGQPKGPTKREIRQLQAATRAATRQQRRRILQRYAFRLDQEGRTLREIARATGVSHQTVSNWVSGAVRRLVS